MAFNGFVMVATQLQVAATLWRPFEDNDFLKLACDFVNYACMCMNFAKDYHKIDLNSWPKFLKYFY